MYKSIEKKNWILQLISQIYESIGNLNCSLRLILRNFDILKFQNYESIENLNFILQMILQIYESFGNLNCSFRVNITKWRIYWKLIMQFRIDVKKLRNFRKEKLHITVDISKLRIYWKTQLAYQGIYYHNTNYCKPKLYFMDGYIYTHKYM